MNEIAIRVNGVRLAQVLGDQIHDERHLPLVLVLSIRDTVKVELALGYLVLRLVQKFVRLNLVAALATFRVATLMVMM